MKNQKLLVIGGFIVLGLVLFFVIKNNTPSNNVVVNKQGGAELTADSPDIVALNKTLREATQLSDIKMCDAIVREDIKQNCISQIRFKFDDMNLAKSPDDCKILGEKDGKTKQERQDICFLNLQQRLAEKPEDRLWCNEIKNQDLKGLCLAQNDLKMRNAPEVLK